MAVIEHPPGEETQFDWLELPDPPAQWGWGVEGVPAGRGAGALRAVARGAGRVHRPAAPGRRACTGSASALGGLTRTWRFDRMATVCHPGTGRITASFAAVAKHYGVSVAICPARPREPQGRGGEGQPHRRAALVAHPGRRRSPPSRPRPRWTGGVCCAATPGCARTSRREGHRGHRRRRRAADPAAGAVPGRPDRRAGRSARRRWSPSAATTTRCHPSWPAPGHGLPPARRAPTSSSPPAAGIVIARHRLGAGRGRRHRPRHRPRPRPGARRAGRVHHRRAAPPQAAHPTRPGRPSRRRRPARQPPLPAHPHRPHRHRRGRREVVIDLARYAAAAQGRNTLR